MKNRPAHFDELVERALAGLPAPIVPLLDNVVIVVKRWPGKGLPPDHAPYGLYEGIPQSERDEGYYGALPDRITIFQGPLMRDFSGEELEEQVRLTVIHELAHHLGFDEERIEELGWG